MATDKFIICAYATKDTSYEEIAKNILVPSIASLELAMSYHVVPNLGSWAKNTSFKASFAQKMLLTHTDKDVVLLDVDSRVLQYPELFNLIPSKYNIAAHILDHNTWYRNGSNKHELLTGTLYLRNNNTTKSIVDDWIKLCKQNPDIWEQKLLARALVMHAEPIYELPISYCYINSLPGNREPFVRCDNPVIKHYQASRELKKEINSV